MRPMRQVLWRVGNVALKNGGDNGDDKIEEATTLAGQAEGAVSVIDGDASKQARATPPVFSPHHRPRPAASRQVLMW